jgi:putative glycosyltransferase (TIGR04372 family)
MQLTLNSFITRQLKQISTDGWLVVWQKLISLLYLILSLPLVILIRLIRPFVIVRMSKVDIGRIGGPYYADWYLSEKVCGWHKGRYLDLFYFIKSINHVNRQWEKMWLRELPIFPWPKLAQSVERLNNLFPGHDRHRIQNLDVMLTKEEHVSYLAGGDSAVYSKYNKRLKFVLENRIPNLSFTADEENYGKKELREMGIPLDSPFICFHNRDSAFLDDKKNDMDWSYHNFRDSSILNYIYAAEEMIQRGCYAIRLGAKANEIVQSNNPEIIDYASNGMRTDFLDIYLSNKCRFILCSDTGISLPAEVFKRPLVYVNWTLPLRVPVYAAYGLVIFKFFHLLNEKRYMSFSEIINLDFGGNNTNEILSELNLELIENTPKEIFDVTVEMDERINGTWVTTKEDEKLQQRFWDLFGPDKLKSPDLRIGTKYLRENQELLK